MKLILILTGLLFLAGCLEDKQNDLGLSGNQPVMENNLKITLLMNSEIYANSIYGEAPQLAVWIEDSSNNILRPLYITRRTAENDWIGKINCDVSLPFWSSKINMYRIDINQFEVEYDVVTSATSSSNLIKIESNIELDNNWICYAELNLSGDFNETFQFNSDKGYPDTEGNGQPSLIYQAKIIHSNSFKDSLTLVGRTFQLEVRDEFSTDLTGITTAKEIIKKAVIEIN